jgi:predicted nucleic acid-binding protein
MDQTISAIDTITLRIPLDIWAPPPLSQGVPHHRDLTLQEADTVAAAALEQYRNRPALGFSDCLILETVRKAGHIPLGTFDRNLSKLNSAEGL